MSGVFISYRRGDASGHAGWLREGLAERLGRDRVFMDIDTIEPGLDFVEVIEQAVDACDVLLVLIGKEWLTTEDADGRRRLDDPDDYHRLEVESALKRGIRVIPVLVHDATMPRAEELPETLRALARRHAYELSDSRWTYDVDGLSAFVKKDLGRRSDDPGGEQPPPPPQPPSPPVPPPEPGSTGRAEGGTPRKRSRRSAIVLVACLAVLGVLVAIGLLVSGGVTREQAEQLTVDFASRKTRVERNQLAAVCSPSGDSWLCGVGTATTACTGGTTVDSGGTVIDETLACEPPAERAGGAGGSVTEGAQRVRFRSGDSSTILEGTVAPGERSKYLLEAQAGQQMTVRLSSAEGNAAFTINKRGGARIGGGESDDAPDWRGELPRSGDYTITVEGTGGAASYELEVGIM